MVTASDVLRSLELHPRTRNRPWDAMDTLGVVAELALQEYHREKRPRVDDPDPVRREAEVEEFEPPPAESVFTDYPRKRRSPPKSARTSAVNPAANGTSSVDLHDSPPRHLPPNHKRARKPKVPSAPASPALPPQPPGPIRGAVPALGEAPPPQPPEPIRSAIPALGEAPPPQPPEKIRSAIAALGGSQTTLVIQKRLTNTDTKKEENRLSIPMRQVASPAFLNEEEKRRLSLRDEKRKLVGIEAELVEPNGESGGTITFKRWDMEKANGSKTSSYVLNRTWYDVVHRHKLRPDTLVQVWSFRLDSKLCFALVVVA